jgi:zinc transport system ATP-binding protein
MSELPLVEARGVTLSRDARVVLDAVDLDVAPGEVCVVIGPNGAGKSSLLAALLGQIPFEGKIALHFRREGHIGLVPQSLVVDRTLPITVAEFLATSRQRMPVCLGLSSATRARIATLLDRVGLAGFGARRLGALSGGELQRVLLANAIDPLPELLLLDEPATGLDQASKRRLEAIVRELCTGAGAAAIMVSHEIGQVRRMADRVIWLDGSVRATGTIEEVVGGGAAFPFTDLETGGA